MKVTVLIPARMGATRFPGKPLTPILGKPMIQWVYERAAASLANRVLVATDAPEIKAAVDAFGGLAVMTRTDHQNGTSRIAEAAEQLDSEIIVNIQGDEPAIHPNAVDAVIKPLIDDPHLETATLAEPITVHEDVFNPNIVKVVTNAAGRALYFSRAPIPFVKHPQMKRINWPAEFTTDHHRHIGVYAYRRDFLLRYVAQPPCALEQIEGLEQLRVLYMGAAMQVVPSQWPGIGVDTPEDVAKAEAFLAENQ